MPAKEGPRGPRPTEDALRETLRYVTDHVRRSVDLRLPGGAESQGIIRALVESRFFQLMGSSAAIHLAVAYAAIRTEDLGRVAPPPAEATVPFISELLHADDPRAVTDAWAAGLPPKERTA